MSFRITPNSIWAFLIGLGIGVSFCITVFTSFRESICPNCDGDVVEKEEINMEAVNLAFQVGGFLYRSKTGLCKSYSCEDQKAASRYIEDARSKSIELDRLVEKDLSMGTNRISTVKSRIRNQDYPMSSIDDVWDFYVSQLK